MCRLLHNAFLFLLAVLPTGVWAQGGIDFHPIEGQTYVIMNAETGEFLFRREGLTPYSWFPLVNHFYPAVTDESTDKQKFSQVYSSALWGIEKSSTGDFSYYIYNKSYDSDNTLTKYYFAKKEDNYYLNETSNTKAAKFYILRSPYNRDGYMVSNSANFRDSLWYVTYTTSGHYGYYIYETGQNGLSLTSISKKTKPAYDLSSFRFLTYDDLWEMYQRTASASASGKSLAGGGTLTSCTYVNASSRTAESYYTLINAIRSFADANRYKPLFRDQSKGANRQTAITAKYGTSVVIKSRRFDTYLARKRNGSLYLSKSIDKNCVWSLVSNVDKNGNDRYALMSMSNMDNTTNPYLTIGADDSTHSYIDFAAASDCNPKYCSLVSYDDKTKLISFYPGTVAVPTTNKGYGQYEETIKTSSTDATNFIDDLPVDWVTCSDWKIVKYDEANNEHVSLTDDQIYSLVTKNTTKQPFFRIENVAYSQMDRGAGWLSDVDHKDELGENYFLACSPNDSTKARINGMPVIDITSTTESKAWAPNLWRLELVRKGTGNPKDMPIGIVSATPHNLYKIKNANSGKYVCWPKATDGSTLANGYFTLKTKPEDADVAYFWLESLDDGEYALALRDPTLNSKLTVSDGKAAGYAQIMKSIQFDLTPTGGTKQTGIEVGPYTAGLYLTKSTTSSPVTPTKDTEFAFDFEQAFTIEAFTGNDNDAGTPTRRYVTAYYPFDIAPADDAVSLYTLYWSRSDGSHVGFKKVDYLPANTGGIAFTKYVDDGSEVFTFKLNPDVTSSDKPTSILTGVTEAENKWFSRDALGKETYTSDTSDPRYNYLVFSSYAYDNDHTTGYGTTLGIYHPVDAYPMTNRGFIDLTAKENEACKNYLISLSQRPSKAKGSLVGLDFDTVPTAIKRIDEPQAYNDGAWYDLQGHKTWFPTHGIYIHNGKKILIR